MLVRRGLAVLSFVGVASLSGLAEAQYFHADPTVRLTAGYTFNHIVSDNSNIEPLTQSGPLVTIAPSLALAYETPLVTQMLTLTGSVGIPFASDFTFNGQPPMYNLRASYDAAVPLDALTRLTIAGSVAAAPINAFGTLQDPSLTSVIAPPTDDSYSFTFNGTETIRRELTEAASLTQSTNVSYNLPFNVDPIRASTLTVKNSLALSRKWTLDTLSLTGAVGVTRFGPAESLTEAPTDTRVQILNNLSVMWRRVLTDSLTGTLQLGVGQTISPETINGQVWQPTGGATFAYNYEPVVLTLAYMYSAMVDPYTATTNLSNQVSLRAVAPISTSGLAMSGSTGYAHSAQVADPELGFNSFTGDLGFTYAPNQLPALSLSLRGTIARQIPIADPLNGVTRYGVTFNLGYSYPNSRATDGAARAGTSFILGPGTGGAVNLGEEVPASNFAPSSGTPYDDIPDAARAPAPAAAP